MSAQANGGRLSVTPFVPKQPEIVQFGKTTVLLYPKVDATMSDLEKAMAYQQNKMALASANLDQQAHILALAKRLNLMLTAESSLADWKRKLTKNWLNFQNLTIISWHDTKGNPINNTTVAGNPAVLLPVQNGAQNQCCSAGVKFVRIQLDLDFADLNTIQGVTNTVFWGEYYLQLPQTRVQLTNAAGNQYNLSTFHGPQDISTLLADEVRRQILDITHQDGPFELLAPAFNLSLCRTKSDRIYGKLKTIVVKLASPTIHDQLFLVLVPGYLVEPHMVLDHIWQNYTNAEGVQHRLGAQVYYTTFLNTIWSFYDLEEYPIDIIGIFLAHINPTYASGFWSNYPNHGKIRSHVALTSVEY
jgi:hypothetical protein